MRTIDNIADVDDINVWEVYLIFNYFDIHLDVWREIY